MYINEFDNDIKYKMYREISEILKPSISKKNISDYKIIFNEKLLPVRIFYPKRLDSIKSIIIYLHGTGKITGLTNCYSYVCQDLAKKCDQLVIAIDYNYPSLSNSSSLDEVYDVVKYIYDNAKKIDILSEKITVMGDSFGATLASNISDLANKNKDFNITKQVFISPIIINNEVNNIKSDFIKETKKIIDDYKNKNKTHKLFELEKMHNSTPDTLIITGEADPFKKSIFKYYENIIKNNKKSKIYEIPYASHNILADKNYNLSDDVFTQIKLFSK